MNRFLKTHAAGLLLALLSGLILGLPHLRAKADRPYLQPDEWIYAATIGTAAEGRWDFSDVYLWEHRNDPWHLSRAPFWICAAAARALGGTDRLFVAMDFVVPPLISFGLYLCLVRLGVRRSVALLATSLYVLHHSDLEALILPATRYDWGPLLRWYAMPLWLDSLLETTSSFTLARTPEPMLSRTLEMAFFLLLFPALRGRRWAIGAAGLLLGLVSHLRFFDSTVLYPALAMGTVLLAWRRQPGAARALAIVTAVGLALYLPALVGSMGRLSDPRWRDAYLHTGYLETRELVPAAIHHFYPVGPALLLLTLPVVLWGGASTPGRAVLACLWAGVAAGAGFQVVTGWTVVPDHWYQNHVLPIFTALVGLGVAGVLFQLLSARVARAVVLALTALSVLHAAGLYGWYRIQPAAYPPGLSEAMRRVEDDAVVMTVWPQQAKVAAPRTWTFLPYASWSAAPTDELLERFLMAMKIYGVDRKHIETLFEPGMHPYIYELIAGVQYHSFDGGLQVRLPAEQRERWLSLYDALPEEPDRLAAAIRARYRLDYVLVSPLRWGPARPLPWPVVAEAGELKVYRVPR